MLVVFLKFKDVREKLVVSYWSHSLLYCYRIFSFSLTIISFMSSFSNMFPVGKCTNICKNVLEFINSLITGIESYS